MQQGLPTLGMFQPLIGQVFQVRGPGGEEASFELVQADDHAERMKLPEGYREPFSLLFRAAAEIDWRQGTFVFSHPALEPVALFTTAVISPDGHGRHAYEVVFN